MSVMILSLNGTLYIISYVYLFGKCCKREGSINNLNNYIHAVIFGIWWFDPLSFEYLPMLMKESTSAQKSKETRYEWILKVLQKVRNKIL